MRFLINGVLLIVLISIAMDFINAKTGIQNPTHTVNIASASPNTQNNMLQADVPPISAAEIAQFIDNTNHSPALLLIYASWCPYCKRYIDVINEIIQQNQNLQILAISIDDNVQDVLDFLATKQNLKFNTKIYTGNRNISYIISQYGGHFSGGVPYTAILQNSKITAQIFGYSNKDNILRIIHK